MFPEPRFIPWVGVRYRRSKRFGARILVLGESHYWEDPHPEDAPRCFTTYVVGLHRGGTHKFFTRIAMLVLREPDDSKTTRRERFSVWDEIAFYNCIQRPMSGPGVPPSGDDWPKAVEPLRRVLAELEPQVVVVLGVRLRNWLEPTTLLQDVQVVWSPHPSAWTRWGAEKDDAVRRFGEALTEAKQGMETGG